MARTSNKLTDTAVKQAKAKQKPFKLADGNGLFILVQPDGKRYWRLAYRYAGKQKVLAIGVYPDISLKEAREKREDARKLLANDIDPSDVKRQKKLARHFATENSFEAVAVEWLAREKLHWSETHTTRIQSLLKHNLLPWLGHRPISEINPQELLAALRRTESKGTLETAQRAKQASGQIFRYAVITGRAERDPSHDLKGALATHKGKHFSAITEPKEVGSLLLAMDEFQGTTVVKAALQISPLLFQRPGEIRHMQWEEIDFENAEWRYMVTKTKTPHIVPLSQQALKILKALRPITERSKYVFPSARGASRPLSENAVRVALRTIGYTNEQMTPHGFRAMARTILDEVLNYRVEWIEHQLAHTVKDSNGTAYNRTKHLPQRKEMMQGWADYLDRLRAIAKGENVVPLNINRVTQSQ